ncbi:MAG: YXWGXW repeat-containing protein [Candidatus Eremiobacteraeota bacterium]|nr:YXWGXW repeat-containing protein [Candidatus Eremiobacteraeota bacterium]MBV8655662.1 YXWGXW repeat-containing protein [Candidatus Eremiobacteraeota bacterium]
MRAFRLFAVPIIALFVFMAYPAPSSAQITIGFTIGAAPPPMPTYDVPPAPYQNYMWQPGYWAWGPAGYYWVPGTWVQPPQTGLYWTPGYWGYNNGGYGWNNGYWAPQVGFYGGINYGAGYYGNGFYGGQWTPSGFSYNTAVWPVNTTVIHNTYINRTVINRTVINRTSYNGGSGGIQMHPDAAQERVLHMQHVQATELQQQHAREAAQDRNLYASVNHGKPAMLTSAKPFTAPPHNDPPTDADKAAAHAQMKGSPEVTAPKHENAQAKPMTPQHHATTPEHNTTAKPPSTEHKPATTEHNTTAKPPSTEHKPATTEHKPPADKPDNGKPPDNKPPVS